MLSIQLNVQMTGHVWIMTFCHASFVLMSDTALLGDSVNMTNRLFSNALILEVIYSCKNISIKC